MTLYFITGNKNKLLEIKALFPEVEHIQLDLPEIQHSDPNMIIQEKLNSALKHGNGEFFCEDTSLYLNCLNGFPGPLIKWFLQSLGSQGIYELVKKYQDPTAIAKTIIGYTNSQETKFFTGELKGTIVEPVGNHFGWDPIYLPEGFNKTLAEMSLEEKNQISMRQQALQKFKKYLQQKK